MTHEKILGMSADELEKLTDKQIIEFYTPYLKFTRPELAEKPERSNNMRKVNDYEHSARVGKAKGLADKFGLDLDGLFD